MDSRPESKIRAPTAVAAAGGLVIVASFFLLPWESFKLPSYGGVSGSEVTNAGHELRLETDDGKLVQGYLVAATMLTAGLGLLLFPLSFVPGLERRFFPIALTVALIALAWIVFSAVFLGKYDVDTAIGVPIAWFGALLIAGGAFAAARLSR